MLVVEKYTASQKSEWDNFLKQSPSGHFMFHRDYMEYHSDRFVDHSLIIRDEKDRVVALLAANELERSLISHQGLTFGGLVFGAKPSASIVVDSVASVKQYMLDNGFKELTYKALPYIYSMLPFQEDLYALFQEGAALFRRDISSTIDLGKVPKYSKGRKWTINKARKEGVEVLECDDFSVFWPLLSDVLMKSHGASPTHTLEEIEYLRGLFADNIKLFVARKNNKVLAGCVVYECKEVVHTQYLANSLEGRDVGALDYLVDRLIKEFYVDRKYFDFGISTEDGGKYLNKGLVAQKEGFGARAVVHDFYKLEV